MFSHFQRYFVSHIFNARTRQRLLILAITGLFLSSFALLVLQSTMGGLQRNRISRSKAIFGHATVHVTTTNRDAIRRLNELIMPLSNKGVDISREYVIELLLQHGGYLAPVIVHGISDDSYRQSFLGERDFEGTLVPSELSYKLRLREGSEFQLISPSHTDTFFGEIPRMAQTQVQERIITDDPEVDAAHVWTRLSLIQNLIKKDVVNTFRLFGEYNYRSLKESIEKEFKEKAYLQTWEEKNQNLVWALNLENAVMIFLFIGMTLLVSLCITSGLMIFFGHIKLDLASFWIQGASKRTIYRSTSKAIHFISFCAIVAGLGGAIIFLELFDQFGPEIMPDVFVDRKIPVAMTGRGVGISFFVPFLISWVFVEISILSFKRENNYLDFIRSLGR
ncbi:hypothetical protein HBN50_06485 [Halobacteriovorax sp. GB3]|uniref:ABC transporter permease n=1 Tax=Halobacteriovorax sp. GB3 TaxID=2719615 RepID=UPI0023621AFE|nr:hypothetical protein [Halobacteriovorax sp. GB3]MDD0852735.1 hypothetical protein [Halobacteriovorax sp. GB3]